MFLIRDLSLCLFSVYCSFSTNTYAVTFPVFLPMGKRRGCGEINYTSVIGVSENLILDLLKGLCHEIDIWPMKLNQNFLYLR
jgi:hypothetical protein